MATAFLFSPYRRLFLCAIALLLAGCAGTVPRPPEETAAVRMPRTYYEAIDIHGRLSLQYQRDEHEESLHGGFEWEQMPGQIAVTMRSPLGQTMATIEITPQGATLQQSGKPPQMATDVDALVAHALGWPLPISGLSNWLQGFAVDSENRPFVASAQGPDTVVTRDGWHIRYADWKSEDDYSPPRPKRIDLARSTREAGDVSIRIAIDDWQPH